jgi:hypothetical protein
MCLQGTLHGDKQEIEMNVDPEFVSHSLRQTQSPEVFEKMKFVCCMPPAFHLQCHAQDILVKRFLPFIIAIYLKFMEFAHIKQSYLTPKVLQDLEK